MNAQELLANYMDGTITAAHYSMAIVDLIDASNVKSVLTSVPEEVLDRLRDFATFYKEGQMIAIKGGTDPGPERVAVLRNWFERH